MITAKNPAWIPLSEAQRRLAIGRPAILKLVAIGRISVRHVEGSKPRVKASEIEDLAKSSTRAATL